MRKFLPNDRITDGEKLFIIKMNYVCLGSFLIVIFEFAPAAATPVGPVQKVKFGNLVKKVHDIGPSEFCFLPEGASIFFTPISHFAMDLRIPPVKEFAKCLHCVSINYQSLNILSSKYFI